jgi:hypothetical protein
MLGFLLTHGIASELGFPNAPEALGFGGKGRLSRLDGFGTP